ncbi:MAG: flagellar biosynthetic protein FliR [Alphaproteobacteria bacterium]|nr:flagellar biosynthetic protein FliR [Alphaproteobacteria bacterium]
METTLNEFMTAGVFAFMLAFTRIGAAMTIMPGIGDSFTPANIRLYIALGLSVCLTPIIMPYLPDPIPSTPVLLSLLGMEFIIGLFIGTIARIFMTALDTAGMIISMQSGLSNAQLFNPAFSSQGSLIGAFLSVTGVVILFASNMHHLLFYGIVGSYELFPIGDIPDSGSMAEMVAGAIAGSFKIGVQLASPFIVIGMLLYICMGVLTRLMPQIQVFMLTMPLQILIALVTLAMVVSTMYMYWLSQFEEGMVFFLQSAQGAP